MPDRQTFRLLAPLTAAFFLSGVAFAVGTPIFQNPDEPPHVDLVHHYAHDPTDLAGPELRQRRGTREAFDAVGLPEKADDADFERLPEQRPDYLPFDSYPAGAEPATDQCPVSCQNYQYGHPPAWYYLSAPIALALDGQPFPATVLWLRLFNVLLVAPMVGLTWWTARQIWPRSTGRPLAAAIVMAAAGPVVATAAAANNDALVLMLITATVALMARILRAGTQPRLALLLGLLVGAGLLTKAQFLAVAPVALLAMLVAPSAGPRWRALVGFAVPVGLGGVWWLENLIRDGSLTRAGSEILVPAHPGPWESASFAGYALNRVPLLMDRIWGSYGWLAVDVPPGWRRVLTIGTLALAAGWLACRQWGWPTRAGLRWLVLATVPLMLVLAVFYASFEVHRSNGEVRGVQGRYVYGAASVLAVGVAAASGAIKQRVARRARTSPLLAAAALASFTLGTIASFALAMRGLYATKSLTVLLDRAAIVAPVAEIELWLGLVTVAWMMVVLNVAVAALRLGASGGADGPAVPASDPNDQVTREVAPGPRLSA